MFDTLKYTKRLEARGFTREQAEEIINTGVQAMSDTVATKSDLKLLSKDFLLFKQEMRADMEAFKQEMRANMDAFKQEMRTEMRELRQDVKLAISESHKEFKTDLYELNHRMNVRMAANSGILFAALTIVLTIFKYT